MKNHLVSEKFLSFSRRIKQPLPRLVIKALRGSNTKRNTKKHNHNIIMKVWTQQNKKKKINSLGCLPTSAIV